MREKREWYLRRWAVQGEVETRLLQVVRDPCTARIGANVEQFRIIHPPQEHRTAVDMRYLG